MEIAIFVMLGAIIGAMLGSFACCQVRRMRRKEKGLKPLGKWSVCEKCGKRLGKKENIPIVSWLVQRGKCKKCGAKIGVTEILSEVGLAAVFGVLGYVFYRDIWHGTMFGNRVFAGEFSTNEWFIIASWILFVILMVVMWMITIYDAKWGKMPTKLLVFAVLLAAVIRLIAIASGGMSDLTSALLNLLAAVAILPGLYLLLYLISRGKLVGDGDWILALAVALLLGDWWLAFFEVFLSNAIASVVAMLMIIRDRKKSKKESFGKEFTIKIPFGPYLVIAYVIIAAFSPIILGMLAR